MQLSQPWRPAAEWKTVVKNQMSHTRNKAATYQSVLSPAAVILERYRVYCMITCSLHVFHILSHALQLARACACLRLLRMQFVFINARIHFECKVNKLKLSLLHPGQTSSGFRTIVITLWYIDSTMC